MYGDLSRAVGPRGATGIFSVIDKYRGAFDCVQTHSENSYVSSVACGIESNTESAVENIMSSDDLRDGTVRLGNVEVAQSSLQLTTTVAIDVTVNAKM